jgi:hypothetical protein
MRRLTLLLILLAGCRAAGDLVGIHYTADAELVA